MYCKFCGNQLDGKPAFCPMCGHPMQYDQGESQGGGSDQSGFANNGFSGGSGQGQKKTWQKYLTPDNIERYAPAAALIPLAMAVVVGVIGALLGLVFFGFGPGYGVYRLIMTILKIVFCAAALGAAAGLVYVAVKTKNVANVWVWVAPVAVLCAFIACLGIAFSWTAVAWIFGILSFVVGLEMLSRITLSGNRMDTPVNPGGAFETYGQFYKAYKEKYPSTKDMERAGVVSSADSYFDGSGLELWGYLLLTWLVSMITCGIAAPWMICKIYQWRISHTVVNGKRFTFDGSGASLLGHWILWEFLTIITCGIYAFFAHVALRKWELSHTYIEGEPVLPNANVSYFDGNSFQYFGYGLLGGLLMVLTCGIATPWVMCMLQGWDTKHQIINNRRLAFSGTGLGFLGEYIIIVLLSLITCGIYTPWGIVRQNKYIIRHTDFCGF